MTDLGVDYGQGSPWGIPTLEDLLEELAIYDATSAAGLIPGSVPQEAESAPRSLTQAPRA